MTEVENENTCFDFSTNKEVQYRTKNEYSPQNSPVEPQTSGGKDWQKLMNLLVQLRKVCGQYFPPVDSSHYSPYMFPNVEPDPYFLGDHIVLGSGKLVLLDKLLPKLFAEDHRVLMFSGFTGYKWLHLTNHRMLNVCEDFLLHRGWTYARLDGSTTRPRRALGNSSFPFTYPRHSPLQSGELSYHAHKAHLM